tara:strand:+ start:2596 stop:2907 length:312 start_codon:yes stop_codon:yes gene_type:complete
MTTFLIVASVGLLALFSVSLYYNYKMGVIVLKAEDNIESCLDKLDESYKVMSKILERPVFFDSLEVRQVIQELTRAREAILYVANKMADFNVKEVEVKDEDKS